VALELFALVVGDHDDRQVGRGVEGFFDALQDEGAEWIGDVGHHDADGVAATAAEGTGGSVGTVAEPAGDGANALFGAGGDIAGERRLVEHDGDGGGGEAAGAGYVQDGGAMVCVLSIRQSVIPLTLAIRTPAARCCCKLFLHQGGMEEGSGGSEEGGMLAFFREDERSAGERKKAAVAAK